MDLLQNGGVLAARAIIAAGGRAEEDTDELEQERRTSTGSSTHMLREAARACSSPAFATRAPRRWQLLNHVRVAI